MRRALFLLGLVAVLLGLGGASVQAEPEFTLGTVGSLPFEWKRIKSMPGEYQEYRTAHMQSDSERARGKLTNLLTTGFEGSGLFSSPSGEALNVWAEMLSLSDVNWTDIHGRFRYRVTDSDGETVLTKDIDATGRDNSWDGGTRYEKGVDDALAQSVARLAAALKRDLAPAWTVFASAREERRRVKAGIATQMSVEDAFYQVVTDGAVARKLPMAKAGKVKSLALGGVVHVTGRLPSGWLQVAEEGRPVGWVPGAVLRPEGATTGAAPVAVAMREPPQRRVATKPLPITFPNGPQRVDDIAVIIGIADYAKMGRDIPNVPPAHADAESFKRYALAALGIRRGNIIDLRDATGAQIERVFGSERTHKGQLFDWVRPGDSRVWVYYAGHGAPAGKEGTAFLVPADADAARIEINGYPLDTLYANLSRIPAKSVTVILEACFSGASQGGTVISRASGIFVRPKAAVVPGNITVIAAGGPEQMASWEEDSSHGLFTKYYLTGMSGEADKKPHGNGDGEVAVDELARYLERTLTYYARRYYGRDQKARIVVGKTK
ncbi:MAG: hypothetical protein HN403_05925 [Rhodospirillales bacterium]|jgi:hypothetical protein|nr:hypothetical protein [Rhodospirillales bacterium]